MKTVAYMLAGEGNVSLEENAAWLFLRSRIGKGARPVRCNELPDFLHRRPPALLWWHYATSTELPPAALATDVLAAIRRYVDRGGSLLLSLLAAQYVVDLGMESVRPNVLELGKWTKECWIPGYPDIRGIASLRGHPLLDGLGNAAYTWSPKPGVPFAAASFEGDTWPAAGRVIGVEREYIRINDARRIIVEYRRGKGRVLALGAHFAFADPNPRFRPHLERLAANCFAYLFTHRPVKHASYWPVPPQGYAEVPRNSPSLKRSVRSWITESPAEGITCRPATANPFDVGGRRILILGQEKGGIEEVWIHPHRILRDLRAVFRVAGGEPPREAEDVEVTISPACVLRRHRLPGAVVEETVFGDRMLPAGAVHCAVDSKVPLVVSLSLKIDLRTMWPLPAPATGTMRYGWDARIHALVVTGHDGTGVSVVGAGRAPDAQRVVTQEGEQHEILLDLEYVLRPGDASLTLVFAGSHRGEREALTAYRRMIENPSARLSLLQRHARTVAGNATVIESPDPEFNRGFRQAVSATARFTATVPGLGTSLMAGYATTARGWDGGHAVSGRPGYAWFFGRDSVWTSFAMLSCGMTEPAREVLAFLGDHQDPTGKILHEMTTSGFVHYDAADATPLYIILMGRYLAATGDVGFVRGEYPRFRRALRYCKSTDTDSDHLIENTDVGHGWIEGGRLFPLHAELYLAACWGEALGQVEYVARGVRDTRLSRWCARERKMVRKSILGSFWNAAEERYSVGKNKDGSFCTDETVLQAVAMIFGMTEASKEGHILDRFASEKFSADWGMRMVPNDVPLYDPAGYHEGSVWPLFTGWTSLAEFGSGRPVQGFIHAMNNLLLAGHWSAGNVPEVLHGETCEPAGVCPHQAWSGSMVLEPLVEGMLGFRADAPARRVGLRPYFPPDWEHAEVRNLRVGTEVITMTMRRRMNRTSFIFSTTARKPLTVEFRPWLPCGAAIHAIRVGSSVAVRDIRVAGPRDVPLQTFLLKGELRVTYEHTGGVAVVPPVPRPAPGAHSTGLRFIREAWNDGVYEFVVEGTGDREYAVDLVTGGVAERIENARILQTDGERLTLGVRFDGPGALQEYRRSTVRLALAF